MKIKCFLQFSFSFVFSHTLQFTPFTNTPSLERHLLSLLIHPVEPDKNEALIHPLAQNNTGTNTKEYWKYVCTFIYIYIYIYIFYFKVRRCGFKFFKYVLFSYFKTTYSNKFHKLIITKTQALVLMSNFKHKITFK